MSLRSIPSATSNDQLPDRGNTAIPVLVVLVGMLIAVVAIVLTALVFSRRHSDS